MGLSHWAHARDRDVYEEAYRTSLGLWSVPFESRHVETPFGSTHVVVSGSPNGEPVIALHAAALSATQWYPQAADLGDSHRLYAVDIMGDIGLSAQTRQVHTRREAAAWLASVLDGLGLERSTFLGSSFGGFHSANLAVYDPDRVSALVLVGDGELIYSPDDATAHARRRIVHAEVEIMPGVGHLMGLQQPDVDDARIGRFLGTASPSDGPPVP